MTLALATKDAGAPLVTPEQLELVRRTVANGATDAELQLFLYDCQRQGVHPLDRLLHFTKRGGKYTPVTSIDLMRIRAAETGDMAGSDRASFTGTPGKADFTAIVVVYRLTQGQRFSYEGEAHWSEYYPGEGGVGTMWRKMPHTMLAKCAEGVALRKAFPRQLAGLYAREELDQADSSNGRASVLSAEASAPGVVPAPAPSLEKPDGFEKWLGVLAGKAAHGSHVLRAFWYESDKAWRMYLLATTPGQWDAIKAEAEAVDANRSEADPIDDVGGGR